MAPPWTRGSLANATAVIPSMVPVAATSPLESWGVSRRTEPGSNSASSRTSGSREMNGAGAARPGGAGGAALAWPGVAEVLLAMTVTGCLLAVGGSTRAGERAAGRGGRP